MNERERKHRVHADFRAYLIFLRNAITQLFTYNFDFLIHRAVCWTPRNGVHIVMTSVNDYSMWKVEEPSDGLKLSAYAESALHKVAIAEGFVHYKFQIEEGSAIGDGFSGVLLKVMVVENDSSRQMNVIVKSPPDNKMRREALGSMKLFEREVFVYNDLLPEFVSFQKEHFLTSGFYEFPKCFFAEFDEAEDDSVIILEDLRDLGYKMIDKKLPINYEHAKLSFAALGRLHAISFALRALKPKVFEKFQQLEDNTKDNLDNEMMAGFMDGCMDRAIATLREDEVKRKDKLLQLKENLSSIMKEITSAPGAEPFAVFNHGDCWSNNFMFKYCVSWQKFIKFLSV